MAITVDAAALWYVAPVECACDDEYDTWCEHDGVGGWSHPMMKATIDGQLYLTDRYVLLPADRLAGWDKIDHAITEVREQSRDGLAEWLTASPLSAPSDRRFYRKFIGALEHAGFLIRPLQGVASTHGICEPDLRVVGLLAPLGLKATPHPDEVRTAAA